MIETIILILGFIALIFLVLALMAIKLSCPFNIFANLSKCFYFWFLDLLFALIWLFIWLVCFIIIYLPIFIIFSIICLFFKPLCIDITPDDVCIGKKDFFLLIDSLYQIVAGERFLYRDDSDCDKCYCHNAVMKMFDPLLNELKFLDELNKSESGNNMMILIISLIILGILYFFNPSKNRKPDISLASVVDIDKLMK